MLRSTDLLTVVFTVALIFFFCFVLFPGLRRTVDMQERLIVQEDLSNSSTADKSPVGDIQDNGDELNIQESARTRQPYDVFLVVDVEGTCEAGSSFDYPNEIIEFPVCLMRWKDDKQRHELVVVDEFRSFVKPSWRPTLSRFCKELTGINQSQVNNAPTFGQVLESVSQFLVKHGVLDEGCCEPLLRFCWCSDGPYDVRDFVVKQCFISKIDMPSWLKGDVLDVKKMVTSWSIMQNYRGRKMKAMLARNHPNRPSLNISSQLRVLGLPAFQGRKHSGIDVVPFKFFMSRHLHTDSNLFFQDARNISRIMSECARRNIRLQPNTRIDPNRRWSWMGKSGQILL
ncbi:ribonuclease H-like domain-containing protein [Lentinula edodes]|uniref:ribonuclease H-like domain-containing protein n=1 Tax=Lentinula edodes TaxID=5353 RepID=UPI001E8D33DC|nr:ribonuclease H-like domain-containing protein [Lentinula edodes]KAH7877631.1 ribonuclease H-like domain-containing protein [Lentinula edodes]KAJ3908527.1 ribonuclease H-like domain-containing protein [Lentinula edodes]